MKKKLISLLLITCLMIPSLMVFAEEDEPTIDIDKFEEILDVIDYNYKYDIDREELIEGAYRGVLDVLDKHSKFYTKAEYEEFMDSLSGSLIGIGIFIEEENGFVKVISPIEGSPAEKAGLKSGDIITYVDGKSVLDLGYNKAINNIKGEVGTEVDIIFKRGDVVDAVTIIREVITVPDVKYEMLDNNIGYIRIVQFGDLVGQDVDKAIVELQKDGMTSIVIDLRNNPGGYLDEVIKIADWFVDRNDEIVIVDYKNFKDKVLVGQKDALDIPVVVLINNASASASEILAGAIKYNDKGILIGETTFGKGSVQSMLLVAGRDGMKLTTAEYFSAEMNKVNNVGVEPDIHLPSISQDELENIATFAPMIDNKISHYGVTSLDVYGAQQRLKLLGYDIDLSGYYDLKTSTAINDFQEKYKLENRSALYTETKDKLNEVVNSYLNEDPQLKKAIEVLTTSE